MIFTKLVVSSRMFKKRCAMKKPLGTQRRRISSTCSVEPPKLFARR
jgi:hypothetical protein